MSDRYIQPQNLSLFRRFMRYVGLSEEPTYIDGYGVQRQAAPLSESAHGQELNRMGSTAKDVGILAVSAMIPSVRLSPIRFMNKAIPVAASADFINNGGLSNVAEDWRNEEYWDVARSVGTGAILGVSVASNVTKIPAVRNYVKNSIEKVKPNIHRSVVLPKGQIRPDKIYTGTPGEDLYNIPKNHKYVGSEYTAKASVPLSKTDRAVIEHYNVPKSKIRVYENDYIGNTRSGVPIYDNVSSIPKSIQPTAYTRFNDPTPKQVLPYNWQDKLKSRLIGINDFTVIATPTLLSNWK